MPKLICVAGPTASGKTDLAIALAKELQGEVVSCDSMQVYRGMDIGTAKPTREEMQGVRHHMLDVADPWEDFSVSRYCQLATPIIDDLLAKGTPVIIAGGTGLYMDALIRGNPFAPCPATGVRERLEAQAREVGLEAMHRQLKDIDPEAAGRIPVADGKRVIRALEVYYETGRTITQHNRYTQTLPPRYEPVWLGLDFVQRADLYHRIDCRVGRMLEQGLLREIQGLLDAGIPAKGTALQAIGYKEFIAALEGQCSVEAAAQQVRQSSRRYAKRQLTWFRRNPAIHWLCRQPETSTEEILSKARHIFLESDK